MIIIVCEEREIIKKIKINWYFNEIMFRIDNLMWVFLKSGYVKKEKKVDSFTGLHAIW